MPASPPQTLPDTLAVNAFLGDAEAAGAVSEGAVAWGMGAEPPVRELFLAPEELPDPTRWRDPRVGWGLVLPENPDLPLDERHTAADAPEPVRRLVAERGRAMGLDGPAPVLRYVPDLPQRFGTLRCYRSGADLALDGTRFGTEPGRIPYYLLIHATPEAIPWHLQFALGAAGFCAGRLDLAEEEGLGRYVDALLSSWAGSARRVEAPVVWGVDDRATPITRLMCDTLAAPLAAKLAADGEFAPGLRFVDGRGEDATAGRLLEALHAARPAFVATTSHGWTLPLDDPAALAAQLGVPVGIGGAGDRVLPAAVLDAWQPDGAVWVAQACCSAGSDRPSRYLDLLQEGSAAHRAVAAVAEAGSLVAPLPRALLGAERPLAAFVGHVEPTFDWTLRHPVTGQHVTGGLVESLYDRLHQARPVPLGHALQAWYRRIGGLYAALEQSRLAFDAGDFAVAPEIPRHRLTAHDAESLVVLGDPTVTVR